MLYFLLRVVVDYVLEPALSWRHFNAEIAYRLRDEDWSQRPREVEKSAMGRWVLIVLGGIPCQTIKLMAMRGIPLTQTWAMLFFAALVFGEILNIAAESSFRNRDAVSTENPTRDPSHPPREADDALLRVAQVFGHLALSVFSAESALDRPSDTIKAAHSSTPVTQDGTGDLQVPVAAALEPPSCRISPWLEIVTEACHSLHASVSTYVLLRATPKIRDQIDLAGLSSNVVHAVFITPLFCLFIVLMHVGRLRRAIQNDTMIISIFYMYGAMSWWMHLLKASGVSTSLLLANIVHVAIVLPTIIIHILFWVILRRLLACLSETKLGRIFGLPRTYLARDHMVDFLATVVVSISGYSRIFDSNGTENPSWLGTFG